MIKPPGDRYYNTSVFCVGEERATTKANKSKAVELTTGNFKECCA